MNADRKHQLVGKPYGAVHDVEMTVGDGVERPGKEGCARHGGGLARGPANRKAVGANVRPEVYRLGVTLYRASKHFSVRGSDAGVKSPMEAKAAADTNIVRRQADAGPKRVVADVCIVGAGIAGTSAALTAARNGRKVVLVDGLPVLGGQAVNSIISTFCGLFANGTHGHQFTHGIADEILRDLGAKEQTLYYRRGPVTTVVYYDEVALARWIEEAIRKAGITVVLGAVLRRVEVDGRRVKRLELATRYGDVHVEATGFIDSSGDAALVWQAGFACREPANRKVFGTQMVVLENIDEAKQPTRDEIGARMKEKGDEYGLVRREGLAFIIPGRGIAAMNMTHVETPLDPLEASARMLDGRDQADRAVAFLRHEFPDCFGKCRVRAYGFPGIRQTRWIVGRQQLDRG